MTRRYYLDFTGTGNSLNILHPRTMGLVMDSLRYWVTDMHVDGFRFDLAPVLVRGYEAGQPSAFFEIIQQDPVLSRSSSSPSPGTSAPTATSWAASRRAGRSGTAPSATACAASGGATGHGPRARLAPDRLERHLRAERPPDLRQRQLRHLPRRLHPHRSRLLRRSKHNEANGEDNRDGTNENYSRNWGVEGPDRVGPDPSGCATG
jgi:isoamylase